ncbi:hypothetical protein Dda_3232 [Drechslerella dactyloides]|uniref:Ribosomal RNA-processing protein 8 n=1 Tax=Drechslerella dactyloides TaxID=74499 RepID=A0AAD6J0Y2_DREDA|nr:hypothetical protein Dda_3232 [Drechslerella dactyloides]
MFAVPAFQSLSSESLKSSFEKRSGGGGVDACRNPANLSSTPNHRKRKHPHHSAESNAASDVAPENIGELWSTIVEGRSDAAASNKPANIATAAAPTASAPATVAPNPQQAGQRRDGRDKGPKSKTRRHSRNDELSRERKKRSKVDHEGDSSSSVHPPTAAVSLSSSGGIKSVKQSDNHTINHPDAHDRISISTSAAHAAAQTASSVAVGPTPDVQSRGPVLTPLQEKMRQKLSGARFRHLNQLLYTTPSRKSLALFSSQPEMFRDYHAGFRQQVEAWPENPVDIFINRLFARGRLRDSGPRGGKFHHKQRQTGPSVTNAVPLGGGGSGPGSGFQDVLESLPLPRARDGFTTVIDLGCGEAALAKAITSAKPRPKIKVHSYDLHAPNPLVTVADIAHLPLQGNSVDVAIFCLALMGTNWPVMIEEAVRVLRNGGEVWIAEIKSRFARSKVGQKDSGDSATAGKEGNRRSKGKKKNSASKAGQEKDDTNPADAFVEERDDNVDQNRWAAGEQSFIEALGRRGLRLKSRNGANKMFVLLDFEKVGGGKGGHAFQIPPKPDMHGRVSRKFHSDDELEVDESSILQPCLYKIR